MAGSVCTRSARIMRARSAEAVVPQRSRGRPVRATELSPMASSEGASSGRVLIAPCVTDVATGGSAGAGAGISAGVATDFDSQSIADKGSPGAVSAASPAGTARSTVTTRRALALHIQLDRCPDFAPLRRHVAEIGIAGETGEAHDRENEDDLENAQHVVLPSSCCFLPVPVAGAAPRVHLYMAFAASSRH